jgi:LysM repeat protein
MRRFATVIVLIFAVLMLGEGLVACTSDASGPPANPEAPSDTMASRTQSRPVASMTPPGSRDRTLQKRLQDASVEARVTRALVDQRRLRVFDFTLESVDGRLTVRGDVNTRQQYRLAERVARSTDGVAAVVNELTINGKPPSEASADASTEAASTAFHTVQAGESLWSIAREYQASVQQLRAMNDLASGSLQPGDRIRVR